MTINLALLSSIATATASAGFLYIPQSPDALELAGAGLIEVNTGMINPNDTTQAAARVLEAGNAWLANNGAQSTPMGGTASNTQAPTSKPTFERTRMAVPASQPRANAGVAGEETYPFSELLPMQNGEMDAFFVGVTEKMKDPSKSMVSVVSAANRRFAKITGTKTNNKGKVIQTYEKRREFKVYPSTDANKPGAWVGRVDDGSKQNLV